MSKTNCLTLLTAIIVCAILLGNENIRNKLSPGFMSTIIIIMALISLYRWSRTAAVSPAQLALIATLAAVAALGRVPFAAIPSVQPTTFLVILSGFIFGPQAGFMVGATAALVSNFFLGQGPWTPWQMLGWGLAGASSYLVFKFKPDISAVGIGVYGFLWGYLFGWIQNLGFWLVFVFPLTLQSFLAAYIASFWFDTVHAVTNFLICFFLFAPVARILKEYRDRIQYSYIKD